jgi:hypothetical protein
MVVLRSNYRDSTKRNMPKAWFDSFPHTRIALDDTLEQGRCFAICLRRVGRLDDCDEFLDKVGRV